MYAKIVSICKLSDRIINNFKVVIKMRQWFICFTSIEHLSDRRKAIGTCTGFGTPYIAQTD